MSDSLLVAVIIVLSEIILLLLGLVYFLFRRIAKAKSLSVDAVVPAQQEKSETSEDSWMSEYLNKELDRTIQRIKQIENSAEALPLQPLKRRMEFLLSERQVSTLMEKESNKNRFWNIVNAHYEDNITPETTSEEEAGASNELIEQKNAEIEKYKELLSQETEKLANANLSLAELVANDNSDSGGDTDTKLESEIEMLKKENAILHSDLSKMEKIPVAASEATDANSETEEIKKELKLYKELVQQADIKIKESGQTIDDLKHMLDEADLTDDLKRMQHNIYKLGNENDELKSKLEHRLRPRPSMMQIDSEQDRQAREEELVMYKDLVAQANDKLKDSNDTIEGFKTIINNNSPSDELAQMEGMVSRLSEDNLVLQGQLDSLNDVQSSPDSGPNDELELYKALVTQANEKLNESHEKIEELKQMASANPAIEEIGQMEGMIEALSQDNAGLRSQIDTIQVSAEEKVSAIESESKKQQQVLCEELGMYKELVAQANAKLKESQETISELKNIVSNSAESDEVTQMQNMLDKLADENTELGRQLELVRSQLQETLNTVETMEMQDNASADELQVLKDEKWFLEEQIRHLLKLDTE